MVSAIIYKLILILEHGELIGTKQNYKLIQKLKYVILANSN